MNVQTIICRPQVSRQTVSFIIVLLLFSLVAGCASQKPKVYSDYKAETNFKAFKTFGYLERLGTDEKEYTALTSTYFKEAAKAQMLALGYTYSDQAPDLLINFFSTRESRTDVRSHPTLNASYGYHNSLHYSFPVYSSDTYTRHYKMGALKIDIVDAKEKKLIWQGSIENKISNEYKNNPQIGIQAMVQLIFQQHPLNSIHTVITTP